MCDNNLGIVYRDMSRYADAENRLLAARDTYKNLGLSQNVASCDYSLGSVYRGVSRYADAETRLLAARDTYDNVGLSQEIAMCDNNLGILYECDLRYADADARYLAARDTYEQLGLTRDVARCDNNLGSLYGSLSRFADAEARYLAARAGRKELGLLEDLASTDWSLGELRLQMHAGDHASALALWIPSLLFMDSLRLQFATPNARAHWSSTIAYRYARVFKLAAHTQDTRLIADLVANAINSGIYSSAHGMPYDETTGAAAAAAAAAAMITALAGTEANPPTGDVETGLTLSGSVAAITGAELPMRPPPTIVNPYDRTTLAAYRDLANDRYGLTNPGRLETY